MVRAFFLLPALMPTTLCAQDIVLSPLGEARLRYESVDQQGFAGADALTLRVRAGVAAKADRWSALIEGQGNLAIIDDYFSGLGGRPQPR